MFDEKAIFIGGMFKSGTTLLRNMLGQHPHLFSGFETKWFLLDDPQSRGNRLEMLSKLYSLNYEDVLRLWKKTGTGTAFLNGFMKDAMSQTAKTRWIDKTPENIMYIDKILTNWPNGKVIHIVRDPRDVFVGRREAKGLDVQGFVEVYEKMFGSSCWMFGQKTDQYIDLRYEDLIYAPQETMKTVLKFIDEPWDNVVSEYHGSDTDYNVVREITGREQTTLKKLKDPMTKKYIGRWKKQITPEEENYIRLKLAKYMKPYGYFEREVA